MAYVRYAGTAKRCGCENPVRHAGALFRRIYPGHLWTHLHPNATGRGTEGGRIPAAESAIETTARHIGWLLPDGI